ncbi:hypothetical protein GCM10010384_09120 [Streptomyces djakartensis]|uniref:Uncharacterized protein n=1 Tax=Streptomyces djakartensis TaxID=68193 RepID=A0ABQ2Z8K3_9ACTN|nr:hypothetical protein GCM10010384_09120 [Streptomyces djakartensis]
MWESPPAVVEIRAQSHLLRCFVPRIRPRCRKGVSGVRAGVGDAEHAVGGAGSVGGVKPGNSLLGITQAAGPGRGWWPGLNAEYVSAVLEPSTVVLNWHILRPGCLKRRGSPGRSKVAGRP